MLVLRNYWISRNAQVRHTWLWHDHRVIAFVRLVFDFSRTSSGRFGAFARRSHAAGQSGITGTHFMSGER